MAAGDRGPTLFSYGTPVDHAERAVLLLHGRDLHPAYMEEQVVRRLHLDGVAYLAPAAPGRTWYPNGFSSPRATNEPALSRSLRTVGAVLEGLRARGFPRRRTFVVGFSPGACLAAEYVARHDHDVGGLVVLTGALIGATAEVEPITGSLAGLPVYFGTSDIDQWIPLGDVEDAAARFAAAGADVRIEVFAGLGHDICDAEIDGARAVLTTPRPEPPPRLRHPK